jgi:hypothetical protein
MAEVASVFVLSLPRTIDVSTGEGRGVVYLGGDGLTADPEMGGTVALTAPAARELGHALVVAAAQATREDEANPGRPLGDDEAA